jgi:hypothetical protein
MATVADRAWGEPVRGGAQPIINTIPAQWKNWEGSPLPPEALNTIKDTLERRVRNLASVAVPEAQRDARESLVAESLVDLLPPKPSKTLFLDEYCAQLARLLKPLATHADPRVRVNAAIVVARVAEIAKSPRLEGLVGDLLANEQPAAIALWGMKAAKPLIESSIQVGQPSTLVARIVPAAQSHDVGFVIPDAYRALIIDVEAMGGKVALINKALTPELLKLFEHRAAKYDNSIPDDPDSEDVAIVHLTRAGVFDTLTAAQQTQIRDLIARVLTGHLKAAEAEAGRLEEVSASVRFIGACLRVLGENPAVNNAKLRDSTGRAMSLIPRAKPSAIVDAVKPMLTALTGVKFGPGGAS